MDNKELKKILLGLSLSTLLAGTSLTGIGYVYAQSSYSGSKADLGDVERGKLLFNDPMLGGSTNDKSCGSCHPGGKGLENASGNIAETVNHCIKTPLAGEGLDIDSQEMKNITAYIKSLKK